VFATKLVNPAGGDGLLAGMPPRWASSCSPSWRQSPSPASARSGFSSSFQVTIGARADVPEESVGLDLSQHGEEAYLGRTWGGAAGTSGSLGGSVVVETFTAEPVAASALPAV